MSTVDDVRERFVRLWGRLGPFWGVSPATARVLAFLLSRPQPEDGDTIAAELDMSRGAVSMACRELTAWGLVHPERSAGSRRVAYRPETEPRKAIRAIVQTRKRREWDPLLEELREWLALLSKERSSEAAVLRARLQDVEAIVSQVDDLADSFLRGGVLQRLGLELVLRNAKKRRKGSGPT